MLLEKAKQLTGGNRLKWMETIRVQSATGKEKAVENELILLAREIQENIDSQELGAVTVFRNTLVPGCFALWLFWDTDEPRTRGSALGMSLAQSLKVFGLVDHCIWIESSETKGGNGHEHGVKKETTLFRS
jgi:hypothetical protein